MTNSFIINPKDDVAVVTKDIKKGEDVTFLLGGTEITVRAADDIPVYHKIAVKSIKAGSNVIKYAERIGYATRNIEVGEHVHTQNLSDIVQKEGRQA